VRKIWRFDSNYSHSGRKRGYISGFEEIANLFAKNWPTLQSQHCTVLKISFCKGKVWKRYLAPWWFLALVCTFKISGKMQLRKCWKPKLSSTFDVSQTPRGFGCAGPVELFGAFGNSFTGVRRGKGKREIKSESEWVRESVWEREREKEREKERESKREEKRFLVFIVVVLPNAWVHVWNGHRAKKPKMKKAKKQFLKVDFWILRRNWKKRLPLPSNCFSHKNSRECNNDSKKVCFTLSKAELLNHYACSTFRDLQVHFLQ
jgi:hypothetical protein